MTEPAWSATVFEEKLREQGRAYHIHHPFNVMLNTGRATREQIQGWVANRYYYQISIPRKDAAILSNCPDRAVRRIWIERILNHDGYGDDPGGIDSWLRLAEAVGLFDDPVRIGFRTQWEAAIAAKGYCVAEGQLVPASKRPFVRVKDNQHPQ